ncbi:hypothetical protein TRVL_03987 [Trypanosoma vivax]|nr:hypothetical protein TRVL_03987 [Trypanosoma vivax]
MALFATLNFIALSKCKFSVHIFSPTKACRSPPPYATQEHKVDRPLPTAWTLSVFTSSVVANLNSYLKLRIHVIFPTTVTITHGIKCIQTCKKRELNVKAN